MEKPISTPVKVTLGLSFLVSGIALVLAGAALLSGDKTTITTA